MSAACSTPQRHCFKAIKSAIRQMWQLFTCCFRHSADEVARSKKERDSTGGMQSPRSVVSPRSTDVDLDVEVDLWTTHRKKREEETPIASHDLWLPMAVFDVWHKAKKRMSKKTKTPELPKPQQRNVLAQPQRTAQANTAVRVPQQQAIARLPSQIPSANTAGAAVQKPSGIVVTRITKRVLMPAVSEPDRSVAVPDTKSKPPRVVPKANSFTQSHNHFMASNLRTSTDSLNSLQSVGSRKSTSAVYGRPKSSWGTAPTGRLPERNANKLVSNAPSSTTGTRSMAGYKTSRTPSAVSAASSTGTTPRYQPGPTSVANAIPVNNRYAAAKTTIIVTEDVETCRRALPAPAQTHGNANTAKRLGNHDTLLTYH